MLFTSSLLVAALVGAAQAQTPKGFTPAVTKQLAVLYNGTAVNTPGELLSKAATASPPQLALPNELASNTTAGNATFMFMMLDLDVPPAENSSDRRVLLHSLTTGFKMTSQTVGGTAKLLASTSDGPAPYIGPGPPATDTIPHRYVQLLFNEPTTLKAKASDFSDTSARIGFDLAKFMQTENLQAPLAGNFFTVDGRATAGGAVASGTGRSGGTAATGTGMMPKNTLQPFLGAGEKVRSDKAMALAGLLGGLTLFVV